MTPPREIICEIEHPNGNIVVRREPNGDHYSVLVGQTNRHPNVNAEGVMRALAHYLHSEIYSHNHKKDDGGKNEFMHSANGKTIYGYFQMVGVRDAPSFFYHRDDGPALIHEHGGIMNRKWYWHNMLHRANGPAVITGSLSREWWYNGQKYPEGKFKPILSKWFGRGLKKLEGDPEECLDETEKFLFRMEVMEFYQKIRR